jgi:hypothetical protein
VFSCRYYQEGITPALENATLANLPAGFKCDSTKIPRWETLNVTVDNGTRWNNDTFMFENVTRQVKRRSRRKAEEESRKRRE